MEQKGIRLYCLYRSVYFSYWDVSCNTDNASYRNISGSIRWNNRGYLFHYGEFMEVAKVKNVYGQVVFEMSFQTEREMLFLERNRYIQVCRENEYAVLYYDNKEEK